MFSFAQQPQSIWSNLKTSYRLYRHVISRVWQWQLLWFLPMLVGYLLKIDANFADQVNDINQLISPFFIKSFIYYLVNILIGLYGMCFMLKLICAAIPGTAIDIRSLFTQTNRKILPVIGGYLVYNFCIIIVASLLGLILSMTGVFSPNSHTFTAEVALGAVAFVLILFVLATFLMFYLPLILLDNNQILTSFKNSIRLLKGNWWRTILVLLCVFLSISIPILAVTSLTYSITKLELAEIVLRLVLSSFLIPFVLSAYLVVFHDAKLRKTPLPT